MKEIQLQCPVQVVEILSEAILFYTDAAFPSGGSECAQSAREALQNAAHNLRDSYDSNTGIARMSRRLRSHVNSAIDYYAEQHALKQDQQQMLKSLLSGKGITPEQWQS